MDELFNCKSCDYCFSYLKGGCRLFQDITFYKKCPCQECLILIPCRNWCQPRQSLSRQYSTRDIVVGIKTNERKM